MDGRTTAVLAEIEKHGQAVKRFRSLCDMHQVPFGEAENLNDLIRSLREDRHFAMDFWAMVGDLSARERGSLTDEEMLDAVVEGSSNLNVEGMLQTANSAEQAAALHELELMLAGIDVGSPTLPDAIAEPEDALRPQGEMKPRREREPDSQSPEKSRPQASQADPADVFKARRTIAEALLRLEETSRELRDQLEAIEELKGRELVERDRANLPVLPVPQQLSQSPGLEGKRERSTEDDDLHPSFAPEVTKTAARDSPEPRSKQVSEPVTAIEDVAQPAKTMPPPWHPATEEQVFTPRPMHSLSRRGLAPAEDTDDDPSIVVPLAAYAESSDRNWTVIALSFAVFLALAGAAWFAVSHGYAENLLAGFGPAAHEKMELFREELRDLRGAGSGSVAKPVSSQQPAPPVSQSSQGSSPPAVTAPPASKKTIVGGPRSTQGQPAKLPSTRTANREQPPAAATYAVRVPSSTMEANLITSRVPIYPDAAKAMEIEGPVVLEVTISSAGAVDFARAVSGDPRLRAAAEEAVLKWRYKPYILQGRAVEAATQVRVVFKLPTR
jgi:TonB family protein